MKSPLGQVQRSGGSPSLEIFKTRWDESLKFDFNDETLTHLALKLSGFKGKLRPSEVL